MCPDRGTARCGGTSGNAEIAKGKRRYEADLAALRAKRIKAYGKRLVFLRLLGKVAKRYQAESGRTIDDIAKSFELGTAGAIRKGEVLLASAFAQWSWGSFKVVYRWGLGEEDLRVLVRLNHDPRHRNGLMAQRLTRKISPSQLVRAVRERLKKINPNSPDVKERDDGSQR